MPAALAVRHEGRLPALFARAQLQLRKAAEPGIVLNSGLGVLDESVKGRSMPLKLACRTHKALSATMSLFAAGDHFLRIESCERRSRPNKTTMHEDIWAEITSRATVVGVPRA
jgi:hypothetical protein